jgi:hypothetical protein
MQRFVHGACRDCSIVGIGTVITPEPKRPQEVVVGPPSHPIPWGSSVWTLVTLGEDMEDEPFDLLCPQYPAQAISCF